MRPTVVLPLVLVAIAALVAVFFMGGETEETPRVQRQSVQEPSTPQPVVPKLPPAELAAARDPVADASAAGGDAASTARQAIEDVVTAEVDTGDRSSRIEVKVVDTAGTPIANALLSLVVKRPGSELAPFLAAAGGADQGLDLNQERVIEGRTNNEGVHTFERLEPSPFYSLDVSHAKFAPKEVRPVALAAGKHTKLTITVDVGVKVHGYVRDEGGNPVDGARMVLMPIGALNLGEAIQIETGKLAKTDANGYYVFDNVDLARTNTISAHKTGFGRSAQTDLRQEGDDTTIEVDFRLAPGLSIRGRVVAAGGAPIEGATIEAYGFVSIQNARGGATTKADGSFELVDLVEGPYQIRARAPGWSEVREPRVDAGEQNLLLELQPLGEITGRVLRARDEQPVTTFRVAVRRVTAGTDHYGPPVLPKDVANARDGTFSLTGVPEGLYVVQVDAEGFAPAVSNSFEARLGQVTAGIEVRLSTGGSIAGRVVNAMTGEPIAGARVATQDNGFIDNPLAQMFGSMMARRTTARTAVSDADGRFALTQLMAGDYQIRIEHNDFTTSIVKDLRVEDSEETFDYGDFPMREGGSIEGIVYDENGAPMNGASVNLSNAEAPGLTYTARTDEEGRYSIEHVSPGRYTIHAMRAIEASGNPFEGLLDVQRSQREVFITDGVRQPFDLSMAQ